MFTNIEGEWDEVMAVVKQAVDAVAADLAAGRAGAQGRPPGRARHRPADAPRSSGSSSGWPAAPMRSDTFHVHTGSRDVVHDLTRECADVRAADEQDGLLHVFVPHATAGLAILETGAGIRRRPARRAGRPAAGRRPLAAPARLRRARPLARDAGAGAAVRHGAGARRPARARHLAEHLPGRPQRRQPRPRGPAVVPGRLNPMTTTPREQPWSDDRPEHGRILVLSANPISAAIDAHRDDRRPRGRGAGRGRRRSRARVPEPRRR